MTDDKAGIKDLSVLVRVAEEIDRAYITDNKSHCHIFFTVTNIS